MDGIEIVRKTDFGLSVFFGFVNGDGDVLQQIILVGQFTDTSEDDLAENIPYISAERDNFGFSFLGDFDSHSFDSKGRRNVIHDFTQDVFDVSHNRFFILSRRRSDMLGLLLLLENILSHLFRHPPFFHSFTDRLSHRRQVFEQGVVRIVARVKTEPFAETALHSFDLLLNGIDDIGKLRADLIDDFPSGVWEQDFESVLDDSRALFHQSTFPKLEDSPLQMFWIVRFVYEVDGASEKRCRNAFEIGKRRYDNYLFGGLFVVRELHYAESDPRAFFFPF